MLVSTRSTDPNPAPTSGDARAIKSHHNLATSFFSFFTSTGDEAKFCFKTHREWQSCRRPLASILRAMPHETSVSAGSSAIYSTPRDSGSSSIHFPIANFFIAGHADLLTSQRQHHHQGDSITALTIGKSSILLSSPHAAVCMTKTTDYLTSA